MLACARPNGAAAGPRSDGFSDALDIYTLKTAVAPPSTFDEAVNTVKQILDDSEKADEIDALRAGTALSVQPAALANAAAFFYMRAVVMNEKRARDATP